MIPEKLSGIGNESEAKIMMYVLMPSPVFLEHNDVKIYEVYKDDTEGVGTYNFIFGLSEWCSDRKKQAIFDVREIDGYDSHLSVKQNLIQMIDKGLLTNLKYVDIHRPWRDLI